MIKNETTNTFNEGMVMDLNPLTTPNNVLTDCLNGTIITYNGNEYVLQNDMGNGRVESAYLPEGYVPVGIKQHGGIIYIASYNPLTNKGQIGTFPSPERNISSSELSNTPVTLSWEGFSIGDTPTFIQRLQIFPDSISIKSGDKFTLIFDGNQDYSKFISNYNNIRFGKINSPKNKMMTLSVATRDNNGNFIDITPQLKRYSDDNKPISFDLNTPDSYKINSGYFTQIREENGTVDDYRENLAVNVYNNKVFGQLYLIAELNIIDQINVSVIGKKIITGDTFNWELTYYIEYTYNCPDGYYSSESTDQYNYVYGNSLDYDPQNVIGGCKISINGEEIDQEWPTKFTSDNHPIYNELTNTYSYVLTYTKSGVGEQILDTTFLPYMKYGEDKVVLKSLQQSVIIDSSKLNTGELKMNQWKYYVDSNNITLRYGIESYPLYGQQIDRLSLEFYQLNKEETSSDPDFVLDLPKRHSYNGTFIQAIPLSNFNIGTVVPIYAVVIKAKVFDDGVPSYRTISIKRLLPSTLFNANYYSEITDFDTLPLEVDLKVNTTLNSTKDLTEYDYNGSMMEDYSVEDWNGIYTKSTQHTSEFKLQTTATIDSNTYPFEVNKNLSYQYSLPNENINKTIDEITYTAEGSQYSSIDGLLDNNEYNIELEEDKLTIKSILESKIVGEKEQIRVSVANLISQLFSRDNYEYLFGSIPPINDDGTSASIMCATSSVAIRIQWGSDEGGYDQHYFRFFRKVRDNNQDHDIKLVETLWGRDEQKDGEASEYMTWHIDDLNSYFTSPIGVLSSAETSLIVPGTSDDGMTSQISKDQNNNAGRHLTWQMIMWKTDTDYILLNPLKYGDESAKSVLTYDIIATLYEIFKNVFIVNDTNTQLSVSVISGSNYIYNNSYSIQYNLGIITQIVEDSILLVGNLDYNQIVQTNLVKLANTLGVKFDDLKVPYLVSSNKEFSSIQNLKITHLSEDLSSEFMQQKTLEENGFDTVARIEESNQKYFISSVDNRGLPLMASNIYVYNEEDNILYDSTTLPKDDPMYKILQYFKLGTVNGRPMIIAKGANSTVRRNLCVTNAGLNTHSDQKTVIYFSDMPVLHFLDKTTVDQFPPNTSHLFYLMDMTNFNTLA